VPDAEQRNATDGVNVRLERKRTVGSHCGSRRSCKKGICERKLPQHND